MAVIECEYFDCPHKQPAAELHWCWNNILHSLAVCAEDVERSRKFDRDWHEDGDRYLYLPIVQPVVGSEQAIAMEVALHAACRLLRICKRDSVKREERDEAEQTLALLRQAQAEAWLRVHGRAA